MFFLKMPKRELSDEPKCSHDDEDPDIEDGCKELNKMS